VIVGQKSPPFHVSSKGGLSAPPLPHCKHKKEEWLDGREHPPSHVSSEGGVVGQKALPRSKCERGVGQKRPRCERAMGDTSSVLRCEQGRLVEVAGTGGKIISVKYMY